MQIDNVLEIYSFQYTKEKPDMSSRDNEIEDLADIFEYCREIKEIVRCDQHLWDIEVEKGVSLAEWLFSSMGQGTEDQKRLIQDLISKTGESSPNGKEVISVSLGRYNSSAYDERSYILSRRNILKNIQNYAEFGEFMSTCSS